jgi:rhodanese-related sulfurtransferase
MIAFATNNQEIAMNGTVTRNELQARIAARVLAQIGYANVVVYAGGKQDWSEAGFALETNLLPA